MFRLVVLLALIIGGGGAVLEHTPGPPVAAVAAFLAYVGVVTTLRVVLWGWRD